MTDGSPLPKDVEQLLRRRLRSLTQLDALLLVRNGPRTATDVARALRISESHAEDELMSLVAHRLLAADGATYSYSPSSKARSTIEAIAGLYPTYRLAIAKVIFSKEDSRLRSFSDALRLRNSDDE